MTRLPLAQVEEHLHHVTQQFAPWRASRTTPRGRIPPPLWAQAVDAARQHGVYRVSIDLRLDYAALKRRVEGSGATVPRGRVAPQFVELLANTAAPSAPAATTVRHECVVELENARGAKLRVQLNGPGVAALAGLCSSFWGA